MARTGRLKRIATIGLAGVLSSTAHLLLWIVARDIQIAVPDGAKPHRHTQFVTPNLPPVELVRTSAIQAESQRTTPQNADLSGAASADQTTEIQTGTQAAQVDIDADYIPRPELSVVPLAQGAVILPVISDPTFEGKHVGILALYIDESGRVHHIRALEPRLPPELEKTAMAAFQDMRYTPGQKNGAIVKSRIKVEVVFENAPVTAPVPLQ